MKQLFPKPSPKKSVLCKISHEKRIFPLLAQGTIREIERWIEQKIQCYELPKESWKEISDRVHEHLIAYKASKVGYMGGD